MARNTSDSIEEYIKELLGQSGIAEIQRSNLADTFQVVPSQINYVIKTRFTESRGYIVESKRGGGGYIRIVKVRFSDKHHMINDLLQNLADQLSEQVFTDLIQLLFDEKIITEKVVKPMREINCSVVGDSYSCVASVLEEVSSVSQDELLSFSDKYLGGSKSTKSEGSKGMASTARIVPAPLTDEQTRLIQQLAKETFRVLGTSGVCRIDFLMDADTKKVYVNEINTIPGSLAFYLWQAAGVSFSELMDKLVELALDRERRRSKMTFSYETNILSNFSASSAKGSKGSKM